MSISLTRGAEAHLPEYVGMLRNSELGRQYFSSEEQARRGVVEFLGTDNFLSAVDEADRIIGFLCYLPQGAFHAFPYLHLLVIHPDFRGTGVGSAIMDQFEKMMAASRNKLFLVAAGFNPGAERFYLKRGYVRIGTIPSLYREGIDEHLMMKKLE